MKKICLFLTIVCTLLIGCVVSVYANSPYPTRSGLYPFYLNGDRNFINVDGHMDTGWYIDRSSLYVEKYNPPQYIICVNVCSVDKADRGNVEIGNVKTYRFFYNWNLKQMYVDRNGNSNWRYLPPQGSWAETGIAMPAGEMAFYLAYGMKFYGSKSFYSDYGHYYYHIYENDFYTPTN